MSERGDSKFGSISNPSFASTPPAEHFPQTMLIELPRPHVKQKETERAGWLFAHSDLQFSPAMKAMHESPGYRWTSHELAGRTGM